MKQYHFPAQKASDECPVVPHATTVRARTLAEATKTLAGALKNDPKLEKDHPEFRGEQPIAKKDEKSQNKKVKV